MDAIEQEICAAAEALAASEQAMQRRDSAIAAGLRVGKTAARLAALAKVSHSRVRQIAMERGIKLARGRPPKHAAPRNGGKP